ncbi:hypothetical protein FXE18_11065 [Vibrio cholerae]|nr:hypothetical protein FXE96_08715 [Vibrio cholerae]TYA65151.1 hypothetical protein FXE18_11065 [Vibrio cholerae]
MSVVLAIIVILLVHMVHTYWLNWSFGSTLKNLRPNNRLKRDCQRAAFPVPLSRSGCSCCV